MLIFWTDIRIIISVHKGIYPYLAHYNIYSYNHPDIHIYIHIYLYMFCVYNHPNTHNC